MTFKIGDKVKITSGNDTGKVVIILEKVMTVKAGEVIPGFETKPDMVSFVWKVRLEKSGEVKKFPDRELEKVE